MGDGHHPSPAERDERIVVPLDPAEFIEALLAVDPDENAEDDSEAEG